MKMVEVFKTNVKRDHQAKEIVDELLQHFPGSKINFDLKDCDKVLRIDGYNDIAPDVIRALKSKGFFCEELE
jgi:hypothetical protein